MSINTACSNSKLSLAFGYHCGSLHGTPAEHAEGGDLAVWRSGAKRILHQANVHSGRGDRTRLGMIFNTPTSVWNQEYPLLPSSQGCSPSLAWFFHEFLGVPLAWFGEPGHT
jgi:hypothetical protein